MIQCSPEIQVQEETVLCHKCGRELNIVNAAISEATEDAIYICFGTLKQKIFVYGKYSETPYGAPVLVRQYSKDECDEKLCEADIRAFLSERGETEYSRLLNCHRGRMECTILSRELVQKRKDDLAAGKLDRIFPNYDDRRKYFCRDDALDLDFTCPCGEKLIELHSGEYREVMGMEDILFLETYLPGLLELKGSTKI